MQFVPAENLKAGMITTKSIYNDDDVLVLAANHTLTDPIIDAVRRCGIEGLFIFDEYSSYEQLRPILNERLRYQTVKELKNFNIDQVIYLTNQIVSDILENKADLLIELNDLLTYDYNTYQHSLNVSTLSTACGIGLGLGNEALQQLALAGALHDIGKRAISKAILHKADKLDEEEMRLMRLHPQLGYDMLYDNNNISAYVRGAILAHHENWDGSGYPRHLAGEDIPVFARVIHIADVYDALIRERSYKQKFSQRETLAYLVDNCDIMFDDTLVNIFMKYLVVYPVGMRVTLSDGRTARVIKNRASHVLRPVIITEDEEKVEIDLAKDIFAKHLSILD